MSDEQFYKMTARIYGAVIVVATVFAACVGSYQSHQYSMTTENNDYRYEELVAVETETEDIEYVPTEVPTIRTSAYVNLTFEDMELLQQIAMIEARGEDAVGQALVMRVVLNRSQKNNMSIRDVIYAPGQFSTFGLGTYIPNDNCNEALEMILNGWDESQGAIYFCADGYNGKEPLFKHGGHYFSKGASR